MTLSYTLVNCRCSYIYGLKKDNRLWKLRRVISQGLLFSAERGRQRRRTLCVTGLCIFYFLQNLLPLAKKPTIFKTEKHIDSSVMGAAVKQASKECSVPCLALSDCAHTRRFTRLQPLFPQVTTHVTLLKFSMC